MCVCVQGVLSVGKIFVIVTEDNLITHNEDLMII